MISLVTGAGGFLGGRLVERLVERGADVRAMVRRRRGPADPACPVEVVEADLTEPATLTRAVAGVSVIYHCAAQSTDWAAWRSFHAANVRGTQNLLAAAVAAGVDRFVHVSTTDVYGYPRQPCREDYGFRDVGLPYNRTKILAEKAIWDCRRRTGLPVVVLRPASIYGPRNKELVVKAASLIASRRLALPGAGLSGAGLIFVDDAADALIAAASAPRALGEALNLRHPEDRTWRDYFAALAGAIGRPGDFPSVARGVAWPAAMVSELACSLMPIGARPVLTRHAINLLTRDQNFPIDRFQTTVPFKPRFDLQCGMAEVARSLESGPG